MVEQVGAGGEVGGWKTAVAAAMPEASPAGYSGSSDGRGAPEPGQRHVQWLALGAFKGSWIARSPLYTRGYATETFDGDTPMGIVEAMRGACQ
jgi:hypothetical protein